MRRIRLHMRQREKPVPLPFAGVRLISSEEIILSDAPDSDVTPSFRKPRAMRKCLGKNNAVLPVECGQKIAFWIQTNSEACGYRNSSGLSSDCLYDFLFP